MSHSQTNKLICVPVIDECQPATWRLPWQRITTKVLACVFVQSQLACHSLGEVWQQLTHHDDVPLKSAGTAHLAIRRMLLASTNGKSGKGHALSVAVRWIRDHTVICVAE